MAVDADGFSGLKALLDKDFPETYLEFFVDVGANTGQTVTAILADFPGATITAIEPVPASFAKLSVLAKDKEGVTIHNIAVGDVPGVARMTANGSSTQNHIVQDGDPDNTIEVPVIRGDAFMVEQRLEYIDYLKIDTEGHDMSVLQSFSGALERQDIKMVEVECGLSPDNDTHVPLETFKAFLEPLGYRVVQIKSLVNDMYFEGRPNLRRCDLVFASLAENKSQQNRPKARGQEEGYEASRGKLNGSARRTSGRSLIKARQWMWRSLCMKNKALSASSQSSDAYRQRD